MNSDTRKQALSGLKDLSMRQLRLHENFWLQKANDVLVEGKPVLFWLVEEADLARKNHDQDRRQRTLAVLTWLLKHGVDCEVSHKGNTVLMEAALRGDRAFARRLLKAGALLDARSRLGNTALHWAAMAGEPAMCKMLLDQGASLELINQQRQTPLSCAADQVRMNTITVLHEAGASWEIKDVKDRTPLETLRHRDEAAFKVWANRPERDRLERGTVGLENPAPAMRSRRI